jgi:hypothetical protein
MPTSSGVWCEKVTVLQSRHLGLRVGVSLYRGMTIALPTTPTLKLSNVGPVKGAAN